MATVYLAHDIKHDRQVAIKVVHRQLGAVLGAERFLTEIRTTAQLHHPNILPLFDSGEADGIVFYVMPYVEGEIAARTDHAGTASSASPRRCGSPVEVADALAHAHKHGVIHRDIKPENILLQDGHALVSDFGIAIAVSHAAGDRITQTGFSVGTPQYMSPEQAAAEREIDGRSDQYSLASVLYEMLAGEPPFTGPNPARAHGADDVGARARYRAAAAVGAGVGGEPRCIRRSRRCPATAFPVSPHLAMHCPSRRG